MNADIQTMREHWIDYAKSVLPPNAPHVQHIECRRAFYAGAQAFYYLMMNMARKTSDTDLEEGEAHIQRVLGEISAYVVTIGTNLEGKDL